MAMFFAAVLLITPIEPPPHENDPNVPAKVREAFYATTRVTNLGLNDSLAASGVTIGIRDGYAYVLTANHVLGRDGERQIDFFRKGQHLLPDRNAKSGDITVIERQAVPDFALLRVRLVDTEGKPVIPPIAKLPPPFERPKRFPFTAYASGCNKPKDGKLEPATLTTTTVTGLKLGRKSESPDLGKFWETDGKHEAGRSGGPLFDNAGRVIGICTANDPTQNRGYFTHVDEIHAWMKKNGFSEFYER